MGAFFTNVQVHAGATDAATARGKLVQALRSAALAGGFVEAGADAPDRTIFVGPAAPWIAVYDEATESQALEPLVSLAELASKTLATAAVSVLVHDSSVLELRLFEGGRQLDRYNSNPSALGKVSARQIASAKGHPERWARWLAGGATAKQLAGAWRDERLFAEDTLGTVAPLLGMDPARASLGYRYACEAPEGLEALRFRHAVRPAAARAEGAPKFERSSYSPAVEFSAGSAAELAGSVRNTGGASKGLAVAVWGDALDRGLVAFDTVALMIGKTRLPPAALQRATGKDGQPILRADFPELDLPAGFSMAEQPRSNPREWMEKLLASQVSAQVAGRALAKGEGSLFLGFLPLAERSGQFGYAMSAKVFAPSRRPLRTAAAAQARLLRELDPGETLIALASSSLEVEQVAPIAAELIERWGTHFPSHGQYELAVFRSKPGARPAAGTAKAAGFFGSARWKKLRTEMMREQLVEARLGEAGPIRARPGDGFAFGRSVLPNERAGDPMLPTLSLRMDLAGRPPGEKAKLRALAIALVDEFMERAAGVQAFLSDWRAHPGGALDLTPYESVCGIGGQCTLLRSWQTRWLRVVGSEATWLGPSLVAQVGQTAELETAAEVAKVGGGVRLSPRGPAELDAIERALEPILPDRAEWERGVRRMYGR